MGRSESGSRAGIHHEPNGWEDISSLSLMNRARRDPGTVRHENKPIKEEKKSDGKQEREIQKGK